MRNNYQWQGQKVKVIFGKCKVVENKDKPLYWYNYECLWDDYNNKPRKSAFDKFTYVPAVKVIFGDEEFVLANHFGIGVHKLINGGWPSYRHFSLPLDGFISKEGLTIDEQFMYIFRKFDLESFEAHEEKRTKWQKRTFPIEYAQHKAKLEYFLK